MSAEQSQLAARLKATMAQFTRPLAAFFAREDVKAVWDWVKEPLYAVLAMFALTTVVVQPFYVPSGSMEPTLAIGDALVATKYSYGWTRYSMPFDHIFLGPSTSVPKPIMGSLPKVGDVVVFRVPREPKITYIKRVIGLPGDHIQMRQGHLWINGRELPLAPAGTEDSEDEAGNYSPVQVFIETLPNGRQHRIFKHGWDGMMDNTDVYVVPPGHIFMMGDNRDNSLDSRWSAEQGGVGYVPAGNLVGHAVILIGSVDFKNAGSILGWPAQFRLSRMLNLVR
jgi:signal peptidase I